MLPRLRQTTIAGMLEAYILTIGVAQIGSILRESQSSGWAAKAGTGKAARCIGIFPRKLDAMKAVAEDSRQRIERLVNEFRQHNELQ